MSGSHVMAVLASPKEFSTFPFLSVFLAECEACWFWLFVKCSVGFLSEAIWFFVMEGLIFDSISLLIVILSKFLFLLFRLGRMSVSRNLSIFPLVVFYFYGINFNVPFIFISWSSLGLLLVSLLLLLLFSGSLFMYFRLPSNSLSSCIHLPIPGYRCALLCPVLLPNSL